MNRPVALLLELGTLADGTKQCVRVNVSQLRQRLVSLDTALPRVGRQAGVRLIMVNRDPTPLDDIANAVVRGQIGAVLPELVRRSG